MRIKPGFFNPPKGRPICVPGFHWMGLMLAGMSGVPLLASLQGWTTRGSCATTGREAARTMLWYAQHNWGRLLLHIFDQGFAGLPWLVVLGEAQVRFVLRWRADYHLCDLQEHKKSPGQLTGHLRAWQQAAFMGCGPPAHYPVEGAGHCRASPCSRFGFPAVLVGCLSAR